MVVAIETVHVRLIFASQFQNYVDYIELFIIKVQYVSEVWMHATRIVEIVVP